MIAAACLVVLLVTSLPSRADDDFSCVKDSLSANHCFAGKVVHPVSVQKGSRRWAVV